MPGKPHQQANQTESASAWSPLKVPVFRALWIATLVSNIGTWMHDIGAGWLMTSLSASPLMVALVQAATTLPVFLLALPAGALADIIDRRRYLIAVQTWMAMVALALCAVTLLDIITAWTLVGLTFAMGIGTAMMMPAWAAITPELVSARQLQPAIALNSMGINVSRAIGPALAGLIIAWLGSWMVFALNAVSYLGVIIVLLCWRRQVQPTGLPTERFFSALKTGVRFARHASELHAAMLRGLAFFLFASASWALLPLLAKNLQNGGPQAFGMLVASIGAGAVAGALILPRFRQKFSSDLLIAMATAVYAGALLALATLNQLWPLTIVMACSGAAWITVLSALQVAAQMALPNWVRSRGLAAFMMTFMGCMALGSILWGKLAQVTSIEQSLLTAAAGAIVAAALSWRWKVSANEALNLTPSMHWPAPVSHTGVTHDRGPVLITIQYQVQADKTRQFLSAISALGRHRRRDGAFAWAVYEDTGKPTHFIETFSVESWLEHLRQHERVTEMDRELQDNIRLLLVPGSLPDVMHYVVPDSSHAAVQ